MTQKLIVVRNYDGQRHNFFFSPGSIDSLESYLNAGWEIIWIEERAGDLAMILEMA